VSADSSPRLPTVAIATIGHHRHGKTTLVAAITRVLARRAGLAVQPRSVEELDRKGGSPPVELFEDQLSPRPGTFHGVPETLTVRGCSLRYATARRAFVHFDAPGRRPWLRNVARVLADADAALLVVSAVDSVQPQTIEHLRLARALGVTQVVVFLGKCDRVTDLDWLDLVERDVRDLLGRCGYDGDATRIVRGAALPVLHDDDVWEPGISDLVDALETDLAVPDHPTTGGPLLYVDHVYPQRQGPRVLVEGRLRRGAIDRADFLWLLGDQAHRVAATSLEHYHHKLDRAVAGDQIGILLATIERRHVFSGAALTNVDGPLVRELVAKVELLPNEHGGRFTPLGDGHAIALVFGALYVPGVVHGPDIRPGAAGVVRIKLARPVYVQPFQRFAVRDGTQGRDWKQGQPARWAGLVGAGQVIAAP
jgi:elongation factor Tu